MKRLPDWPARLAALMDASLAKPAAWGVNDCVTFGADDVVAVTGADPLADLRGRWRTELGAARVARRLGGFVEAITERLGPTVSPLHARRGDLLLLPGALVVGRWPGCLAVCFGAQCGTPGGYRLEFRSVADATLCWRVGD